MGERDSGILIVAGARPNFIKVAPIIEALTGLGAPPSFVHTGQHYDFEMSEVFFRDLQLPKPDFHLGVGSGTHAEQTARVMLALEPVLVAQKPELVIVVGDVNSTLACALVASKLDVRVAHVEAGLRSRDRTMPEETNRLLTDTISDYLFTPSEDGNENLIREGISEGKIHFVGNVMIDTLRKYEAQAKAKCEWRRFGLSSRNYALLTLHRPSNVENHAVLEGLVDALSSIQSSLPVLFPIHPRTRARLFQGSLGSRLEHLPRLVLCEPLGYIDFLSIMADSLFVLTDSGGVQEETTALGVPCLTLRANTERPVTVTHGTNQVVGVDPRAILKATDNLLIGRPVAPAVPPLWDGRAGSRIAEIIVAEADAGWPAR
jgi:UDP-N-acetylglucosamine 2-epimerase (non-hydrolysing)